jgi:hypothetical protein
MTYALFYISIRLYYQDTFYYEAKNIKLAPKVGEKCEFYKNKPCPSLIGFMILLHIDSSMPLWIMLTDVPRSGGVQGRSRILSI